MKKQTLPNLGYEYDALVPAISEDIMKLHHTKHHQGYVDKANKALEKLEENDVNFKHIYKDLSFNLNGHLLHSIFWEIMRPFQEQNSPPKPTEELLAEKYGSFDLFKEKFSNAAKAVEGSGWAALVKNSEDELQIIQIENHNKLYLSEFHIVMLVDVWEHAYYLDYMNDRERYLENWWNVVHWDNVTGRLLKEVN